MIAEIKNKVSQSASFIDEVFDTGQTLNYQLIFQIGLDGITITINEKAKNKYIAFERYVFQNSYNFDIVSELLEQVIKDSKLLDHKYKSITCLIINNLSTLVPNPLFEEGRKKTYLKFNASVRGDESIEVDEIKNLDGKNVFAVPSVLKIRLDRLYNNISYHHFSSGLLDSLLAQNKHIAGKKLFVHVQATHFEAIVIEEKKLLFYNTFNHHSPEDFIYYLLFVCEQLQLNPSTIEVVFLGEIEKNSAIYTLTQKYIRNIKFGARTDSADYSYQLQTFPKHFYFTLFNSYLV
ncbi:MAG: DUF3822 family protein [Bacteroidota bacterium]